VPLASENVVVPIPPPLREALADGVAGHARAHAGFVTVMVWQ